VLGRAVRRERARQLHARFDDCRSRSSFLQCAETTIGKFQPSGPFWAGNPTGRQLRGMLMKSMLGIAVLACLASSARADAANDANAGMEALNRGDVVAALQLFNRAIDSGTLSQNDLAFAYVERGRTYLQKDEPNHARRDADKALTLNPTDPDGKALWLQTTIEAQPGGEHEEFGRNPTLLRYDCSPIGNQNSPAALILEAYSGISDAGVPPRWVRSPNFGEKGRKLSANVNGSVVIWHSHEETDNSTYLDQDLIIDSDTGILTNDFRTSSGVHGERQYMCHQYRQPQRVAPQRQQFVPPQ